MPMLKPVCDCGLIDTHTHWVPSSFPAYVGGRKGVAWPSIAPAESSCQRHVMIQDKVYRTIPTSCFDFDERARNMAQTGVTRQVVSPMPELLSYWLEPEDGQSLIRYLNDSLAAQVGGQPDQFIALGAVPLQDVDMAILELERVVGELGMAGVEIGSNINGKPIGHPDFAPFFEAAQSLGAAIFVHALRPAGMDRLVGPPALEQALAFPGEIGLSAASMITSGRLAALPHLRIAFSHGGGVFSILLARLTHAWKQMPKLKEAMPQSPELYARRFFYDTILFDASALRHVIHTFGASQVVAGSDYPFNLGDPDPVGTVNQAGLDAATVRAILRENPERFLGRVPDAQAA